MALHENLGPLAEILGVKKREEEILASAQETTWEGKKLAEEIGNLFVRMQAEIKEGSEWEVIKKANPTIEKLLAYQGDDHKHSALNKFYDMRMWEIKTKALEDKYAKGLLDFLDELRQLQGDMLKIIGEAKI